MRIRYLSYGITKTGGYRHENCLFESLVKHYAERGKVKAERHRRQRLFESLPAYLNLLIWAFFKAGADINIVTGRTAVPAILRNLFNRKSVWIVLHNYDEDDGKAARLTWYFERMFGLLRKYPHGRFKVIVVAPYWLRYFQETKGLKHVYLFPNLFDNAFYLPFHTAHKNAWVHLGQFSSKNDSEIFELAAMLSQKGYYCYFSTLNPAEARSSNGRFEVICFNGFNDYLEHLSRSCCSLALSRVKEGWSRTSHESILVGTPVIGYDRGGLGDLLKASNSVIVKNIHEAYTCITESLWVLPDSSFMQPYDLQKAKDYLKPICRD